MRLSNIEYVYFSFPSSFRPRTWASKHLRYCWNLSCYSAPRSFSLFGFLITYCASFLAIWCVPIKTFISLQATNFTLGYFNCFQGFSFQARPSGEKVFYFKIVQAHILTFSFFLFSLKFPFGLVSNLLKNVLEFVSLKKCFVYPFGIHYKQILTLI